MSAPVLFWVQHLLGSGHLRRTAAIARALSDQGVETVIASGGMPLSHLESGAARLVQLPAIHASAAGFSCLVDDNGAPVGDRLWDERENVLEELATTLRPGVVVTETYPFGRRQLRREALTLIEAATRSEPRPVVVCSVRDILQRASKPERYDEMLAVALDHYDHVLVHGDPDLISFSDTFPLAKALGDRVIHTGYIASAPATHQGTAGSGEVIVSAGGGAVGAELLSTAIAARGLAEQAGGLTWRMLTGDPSLSEALDTRAEGLIVEPNRPDFPELLANCAVSVSQGGYNTVIDLVQASARAVIVPFAGEGETEQTERTRKLAQRDMVEIIEEDELTPENLAAAVDRALDRPRLDAGEINLDGVRHSARCLAQWAGHD
ncbi:MAG: glycosyl transferase family 28 [Rhodospirillaceae bacterium]|nr:glycosyl transferase family 28 [Rhodospirillaceae bacterium]|tara:strand:- start:850 stop:1986 length:1137 start_codon:yes stop_codon:yes gene_type:complete